MPKKEKKRADGLVEKTVTDPRTGKRIHFYWHAEAVAMKKILEYTEKSEKVRLFSDVAKEWHDIHWPELAPNTPRSYNPAYRRAVDEFGEEYIREIRPQEIKRFILEFSIGGKSKKVVTTQLNILSMIFAYAVSEGDIEYSPCDHISVPKNLSKKRREAASEEDEKRVKQSQKDWLLPYLILYTGLRKGEALALTYEDIDRKENLIHVTKSVYHNPNKPMIKCPKTEAGNRTVPILDPLKKVIPRKKTGYLFSEDGGKTPLSAGQYERRWNAYIKRVGITCTAHQLRHSYATMLFECGITVKDAQDLLGHSTAAMTQDIYTHLRNDRKKQTAKILNDSLSKKSN